MEDITTTPPLAGMLTCSLSWGIVNNLNQHQIAHHIYKNNKKESQLWRAEPDVGVQRLCCKTKLASQKNFPWGEHSAVNSHHFYSSENFGKENYISLLIPGEAIFASRYISCQDGPWGSMVRVQVGTTHIMLYHFGKWLVNSKFAGLLNITFFLGILVSSLKAGCAT